MVLAESNCAINVINNNLISIKFYRNNCHPFFKLKKRTKEYSVAQNNF